MIKFASIHFHLLYTIYWSQHFLSFLWHLWIAKWSCITNFSMACYCNILDLLLHHTFAWKVVSPDEFQIFSYTMPIFLRRTLNYMTCLMIMTPKYMGLFVGNVWHLSHICLFDFSILRQFFYTPCSILKSLSLSTFSCELYLSYKSEVTRGVPASSLYHTSACPIPGIQMPPSPLVNRGLL